MTKAIRLTVALMAALAFTASWADDGDSKKCEPKDMPCATAVQQGGTSEESTSEGSGSGEVSASASTSSDTATNEIYWENQQHEHWESGD